MPKVPPQPEVNRIDLLWKIIGRFDTYVGTTNPKATLLLTFDTFVVSALSLKWVDVSSQFSGYPTAQRWVSGLLVLATFAALASMAFAFSAIAPYLRSHKAPGKYHSFLFFEHVAEHALGTDYHEAVAAVGTTEIERELATQAHALSRGLRTKFRYLRFSVLLILLGVLIPAAIVVLMRVMLAISRTPAASV